MRFHLLRLRLWFASDVLPSLWWLLLTWLGTLHAVAVSYAVLWLAWNDSFGTPDEALPRRLVFAAMGYATAAVIICMAMAAAAGHRSRRRAGTLAALLTSAYAAYLVYATWDRVGMPDGTRRITAPVLDVLAMPVVWPAAFAAAVMAGRLLLWGRFRSRARY